MTESKSSAAQAPASSATESKPEEKVSVSAKARTSKKASTSKTTTKTTRASAKKVQAEVSVEKIEAQTTQSVTEKKETPQTNPASDPLAEKKTTGTTTQKPSKQSPAKKPAVAQKNPNPANVKQNRKGKKNPARLNQNRGQAPGNKRTFLMSGKETLSSTMFPNMQKVDSPEAIENASVSIIDRENAWLVGISTDANHPVNVPVSHAGDSKVPPQVMKLPKVPPETRPGRAAMFGNAPLDPVQYVPRQKSQDFSKAYLKEVVYVDSDTAQQVLESSYHHTNKNLSIIMTVLRHYDKKSFREVQKLILLRLSEIETHFNSRIAEVTAQLEKFVPEENRRIAFHDVQRHYTVPISTPYSLKYITCIRLLDRLIGRLEAQHISCLLDIDELESAVKNEREILFKFARQVFHERENRLIDARKHSNPGLANEISREEMRAEQAMDQVLVEEQK